MFRSFGIHHWTGLFVSYMYIIKGRSCWKERAYLGGATSGHGVHGALAEVRRGFHVGFGLVVVGHFDY